MNYIEKNMQIINEAVNQIDYISFEQLADECVNVLKEGNKLIASGLGKNVPICEKFEGTLLSLGLNAFFLHTNSALHGDLGAVKDGDLIIVLTKSGSTEESIKLVENLEMRKVNIWLLTFNENGILSQRIDKKIVINLLHEGDPWNIVPNNSTTLNLIVLQALAMRIADKLNLTLQDFKRNHPGGSIGVQLRNEGDCVCMK